MESEPFALYTSCGCEIFSNDRRMKLILVKALSFAAASETECYVAHCYVRDGRDWQRANAAHSFASVESFVAALAKTQEFSRGVLELNKSKHS